MDLSEVKKLEEKQQLHELAEAIRRGAKMKPQCRLSLFHDGHSCAIGAAMDGSGAQTDFALETLFPVLNNTFKFEKLMRRIVNLNDHFGWSRERIADWIDTL